MFRISLIPQSSDHDMQISVSGNILTIDGHAIDFSPLGEGEQCDTDLPLVGKARRVDGVIEVGVLLKYSTITAEPIQSANPADYIVEVATGKVPDVIRRKPVVEVPPMETADAQASN